MRLGLLHKQTCTVKRRDLSKDYWENGKLYNNGVDTLFMASGSPQPLTGEEVLQLTETDRKRKILNFYTTDNIQTNDIIELKDGSYEVQAVNNWEAYRFKHKKARIAFVDEQYE